MERRSAGRDPAFSLPLPQVVTKYAYRHRWKRAAVAVLDAAGRRLFSRRRPEFFSPKNLLIIRLDHLGDVWNMTGLPKAVKEHCAGCRVTCLVSNDAAPLLEGNPFVDEILRFDAPWFWKKRKASALSSLLPELKRRGFDAALSLRGDLREHWLVLRAGIARRIGTGISGGGFLLTDCVPYNEQAHELERLSALGECLALPKKIWAPEIHFEAGERERLLAEADAKGLRRGRRFIAYQIEAGTSAKSWPVEYAARFLSELLAKKHDVAVVLLGTGANRADEVLLKVDIAVRGRVLNGVGGLSLRGLAAAAERFELAVAPDSGPAHMLSWLGVPTLFLYSGTNRFESWKPMAEGTAVLQNPVSCAPCGLRVCAVEGHPCMTGIDPGRVAAWVLERLR